MKDLRDVKVKSLQSLGFWKDQWSRIAGSLLLWGTLLFPELGVGGHHSASCCHYALELSLIAKYCCSA